jgi:phosphatidylserine/phosphatidylglycerophosphate/cardiolipin synthase-like enzyme
MDKRSLLVNYELLVRVRNTELAREGLNFFETALNNCRRIEPAHWKSSRNFWNRLKERWAYFLLSRVDPYLTRLQLEVLYREIEVDRHHAQSTGLTY